MKWLDNWFLKMSKRAWEAQRREEEMPVPRNISLSKTIKYNTFTEPADAIAGNRFSAEGFNFTIYPATGGYAVEYRTYDLNKDRNISKLHVIPIDCNLGEEITKIITYECLRG